MTGPKLLLQAVALGAILGTVFAVLTNQGPLTPTGAYPAPRTETRWIQPPALTTAPTTPTKSQRTSTTTSGNTATPTPTTHPQTAPTTTAPSTSTSQMATTGTSTPDPTTTTSNPTTTTEEAAVTTTTPTSDSNTSITKIGTAGLTTVQVQDGLVDVTSSGRGPVWTPDCAEEIAGLLLKAAKVARAQAGCIRSDRGRS